MKEWMECFKNRPQTWKQRRKQLESENRIGHSATGRYPHFLGFWSSESESIFWEAKKIIDAPLGLSEERYPDELGRILVYWMGKHEDISNFWRVFEHLRGDWYHQCDTRCVEYNLPKFVMRRHAV